MSEIIKITERNILFSQPFHFMGASFVFNIALILGERNNFIIDTGFGSESVAPVLEYISKNASNKPTIAVNTHSHWDHVWGNCALQNHTIIAHKLCREFASRDWESEHKKWKSYIQGNAEKCLPNTTFEGSLHFPDDGVEIFHSPGHSADCISIFHAPHKVLHAGDNIGSENSGFIPHIETDRQTFAQLIQAYKNIPFETCISTHSKTPHSRGILAIMENPLTSPIANDVT
jgi:glyoxylase-like metal-dependent hydrolase (beta-lactamase superfamily II)